MYPLDSYWTKKKLKPQMRLPNTSCWRGYIATWEIIDNVLYLNDIIFNTPEGDVGLDYVFPESTGKIKANWHTGELKISFGNRLKTFRGYDPLYEADLFLSIKKGNVISHRYKANY